MHTVSGQRIRGRLLPLCCQMRVERRMDVYDLPAAPALVEQPGGITRQDIVIALVRLGIGIPAGRDTYPQPYEGYDDVLARYSAWLLDQRRRGWKVVDIHTPLNAHLTAKRKETPAYALAGDGVHLN